MINLRSPPNKANYKIQTMKEKGKRSDFLPGLLRAARWARLAELVSSGGIPSTPLEQKAMTGSRGVSGVLYLYGHLQAVRRGLLVVVEVVVRPFLAHLASPSFASPAVLSGVKFG
ncbi:hypothetical protein E2C01_038412 [Portunus trituberculatus]|uniref:Uncharacterized protein n=1 Tax=Portunus trituberculatus TaxID=210409 RepID=A0A5B7FHX1_PORTR|nr:hypothetical protein [Portunus trituberculatus]